MNPDIGKLEVTVIVEGVQRYRKNWLKNLENVRGDKFPHMEFNFRVKE